MRLVERSLHACVNRWSNAAIINIARKMISTTKYNEGNGCPLWTIGHSSKLLISEVLFFSELSGQLSQFSHCALQSRRSSKSTDEIFHHYLSLWSKKCNSSRTVFVYFRDHVIENMAFKTTHNKDESLPQFMKSPQLIFSHKNS